MGLCVGRGCVRVITVEKKVICKKLNLSALSGILGHFKLEFRKKKNGNFSYLGGAVGWKQVKKKKKKKYFF